MPAPGVPSPSPASAVPEPKPNEPEGRDPRAARGRGAPACVESRGHRRPRGAVAGRADRLRRHRRTGHVRSCGDLCPVPAGHRPSPAGGPGGALDRVALRRGAQVRPGARHRDQPVRRVTGHRGRRRARSQPGHADAGDHQRPGLPSAAAAETSSTWEPAPTRDAATKTYTTTAGDRPAVRRAPRRPAIHRRRWRACRAPSSRRSPRARGRPASRARWPGSTGARPRPGYEYATAREWALKLKELARVFADPYSAADFQHGPLALVEPGVPVLAVVPEGVASAGLVELLGSLRDRGAEVLTLSDSEAIRSSGRRSVTLPANVPEWLRPIVSMLGPPSCSPTTSPGRAAWIRRCRATCPR